MCSGYNGNPLNLIMVFDLSGYTISLLLLITSVYCFVEPEYVSDMAQINHITHEQVYLLTKRTVYGVWVPNVLVRASAYLTDVNEEELFLNIFTGLWYSTWRTIPRAARYASRISLGLFAFTFLRFETFTIPTNQHFVRFLSTRIADFVGINTNDLPKQKKCLPIRSGMPWTRWSPPLTILRHQSSAS